MSKDLELHVAALILDAARDNGETLGVFLEDLQPLLERKYGIRFSQDLISRSLKHLEEIGVVERMPSILAGDLLEISVVRAFQFYGDDARQPGPGTTLEYDRFFEIANNQKLPVKAYAYGGKTWVDRVIASLNSTEFPDVSPLGDEVKSISVPASDRIVSLSHNQQAEITHAAEEVEECLRQENSVEGDSSLRERFLAQLAAGRELVRSGSVRSYLVYETLALMLGTLIQKYKGHALGAAATKLLELLIEHIFGK